MSIPDAGNYPMKQARDFRRGRARPIRLLVVHATATGEGDRVAETIQQTWTTDDGRIGSTHLIADGNSVVRSVHDRDTAYGAKSANADGLHGEIVGQINQTAAQYADEQSRGAITGMALAFARWAVANNIPIRRLTVAQVRDGKTKGITDHATVEKAFPSTGHTDPGPNFPWASFLKQVSDFAADLRHPATPEPEKPLPPHPSWWTHTTQPGESSPEVASALKVLADPHYPMQRTLDGDIAALFRFIQNYSGERPTGALTLNTANVIAHWHEEHAA
jgi:hypothetical protein